MKNKVKFPYYAAGMILVMLLAMTAAALSGEKTVVADVVAWSRELPVDPRVVAQIDRYSEEEDDLGAGYSARTAERLRALLIHDTYRGLMDLSAAPAEPLVDVAFPDPGFADPDRREPESGHQREFEDGFIRIEARVFLKTDGVTPERALEMYTAPSFRMEMSSRIKNIWTEDGLSCVEVNGIRGLLSPTYGCNRTDLIVRPGWAAQHSQVVSNPGGDDYQTTYFKESLKTFIAVPGGLVLYYINYTRAVKLGSIKRKIGRGKIEDSETGKIRELQNRLLNETN
jgi:hypothetical protein